MANSCCFNYILIVYCHWNISWLSNKKCEKQSNILILHQLRNYIWRWIIHDFFDGDSCCAALGDDGEDCIRFIEVKSILFKSCLLFNTWDAWSLRIFYNSHRTSNTQEVPFSFSHNATKNKGVFSVEGCFFPPSLTQICPSILVIS